MVSRDAQIVSEHAEFNFILEAECGVLTKFGGPRFLGRHGLSVSSQICLSPGVVCVEEMGELTQIVSALIGRPSRR